MTKRITPKTPAEAATDDVTAQDRRKSDQVAADLPGGSPHSINETRDKTPEQVRESLDRIESSRGREIYVGADQKLMDAVGAVGVALAGALTGSLAATGHGDAVKAYLKRAVADLLKGLNAGLSEGAIAAEVRPADSDGRRIAGVDAAEPGSSDVKGDDNYTFTFEFEPISTPVESPHPGDADEKPAAYPASRGTYQNKSCVDVGDQVYYYDAEHPDGTPATALTAAEDPYDLITVWLPHAPTPVRVDGCRWLPADLREIIKYRKVENMRAFAVPPASYRALQARDAENRRKHGEARDVSYRKRAELDAPAHWVTHGPRVGQDVYFCPADTNQPWLAGKIIRVRTPNLVDISLPDGPVAAHRTHVSYMASTRDVLLRYGGERPAGACLGVKWLPPYPWQAPLITAAGLSPVTPTENQSECDPQQ